MSFQKKWDKHLKRFHELSDRHWEAHETPTGDDNMDWLGPCGSVLDIGCGYGHAGIKLIGSGKKVSGLDIHPLNVEQAKSKGLDARLGDMHDLPFPEEFFDGAMLWDVLEHCLAPLVVLWECQRVLKSGGRLLIYIPSDSWADHPVHTIIPTRTQMQHLFNKSGFRQEAVFDINGGGSRYHATRL